MKRYWLIEYRKNKKLNIYETAEKIGIDRSFYNQIELGTRNPSVETAKRIAAFYGFKWYIFFEDKHGETQQTTG